MASLAQSLQSGTGSSADNPPRGLCVLAEGFSLLACVSISRLDGDALERLARYCARPPLPLRRLSLGQDGQILRSVIEAPCNASSRTGSGPRRLRRFIDVAAELRSGYRNSAA